MTANFSAEILKARRAWSEVFQALNENNFHPRIVYPAKVSFKIDGAIKIFHDKQKLKQYMITKPSLQKMKVNKTMRVWEASNHRRRKDKQSESSID
jgi:hypothetical protein